MIGEFGPIASQLCKLELLERRGVELELTVRGRAVLRRTAGRSDGLCAYIPAAQWEFLQDAGPMGD